MAGAEHDEAERLAGLPAWKRRGERAPRRGEAKRAFEPEQYGDGLRQALTEIDALIARGEELDLQALHSILRRHPRHGSGFFSRSQLLAGLDYYAARGLNLQTPRDELRQSLSMRPVRSLSGVAPVTVFTRPFPCPGRCVFCPNDVRMPKSYLSDEPGAQRAEDNEFDPYRQTYSRLEVYAALGHATDKIELIVLGGTWSHYPENYQRWFVQRCFEALNDFGVRDGRTESAQHGALAASFRELPQLPDTGASAGAYNERVSAHLRQQSGEAGTESAPWAELERAHGDNERAASRCVGLVFETRPDHISEQEVLRLRRLGATKLQLGIQSLDDDVLRLNQRGHDSATTRHAVKLLREAGFKVHAHFMPNLLGSDPERDRAGFAQLFEDPSLRPDELKLYPCSLVRTADLMHHYERGEFRPYGDAELEAILEHALLTTPRYCRLTRIVRDISSDDIVAGNRRTNLREVVERKLAARGLGSADIRAREVRSKPVDPEALRVRETRYATAVGEEVFLEWVSEEDRLAAFLRLSLPARGSFIDELGDSAVIRELHVYGRAVKLGLRGDGPAQHLGLGRTLVERAGAIASAAGKSSMAVISAVGTRPYYASLGFAPGSLYQHLALDPQVR